MQIMSDEAVFQPGAHAYMVGVTADGDIDCVPVLTTDIENGGQTIRALGPDAEEFVFSQQDHGSWFSKQVTQYDDLLLLPARLASRAFDMPLDPAQLQYQSLNFVAVSKQPRRIADGRERDYKLTVQDFCVIGQMLGLPRLMIPDTTTRGEVVAIHDDMLLVALRGEFGSASLAYRPLFFSI